MTEAMHSDRSNSTPSRFKERTNLRLMRSFIPQPVPILQKSWKKLKFDLNLNMFLKREWQNVHQERVSLRLMTATLPKNLYCLGSHLVHPVRFVQWTRQTSGRSSITPSESNIRNQQKAISHSAKPDKIVHAEIVMSTLNVSHWVLRLCEDCTNVMNVPKSPPSLANTIYTSFEVMSGHPCTHRSVVSLIGA